MGGTWSAPRRATLLPLVVEHRYDGATRDGTGVDRRPVHSRPPGGRRQCARVEQAGQTSRAGTGHLCSVLTRTRDPQTVVSQA